MSEPAITVTAVHKIGEGAAKAAIARHYSRMRIPITSQHVTFRILEGRSGGMSSSGPSLGDTTIRVPDSIRQPGTPSSMTLASADVAAILATVFTAALGIDIGPERVHFDVTAGGGFGFSRSGPRFNHASVTTMTDVGNSMGDQT